VKKLILKCGLSPGDIVMLTAAVRDLHLCYPGQFLTDVRTSCPELWENNPYITPLPGGERGIEQMDCSYPLINHSNQRPYHCLHGFIESFNARLRLVIKPTAFKGDIHLSDQEKAWDSQVREVTGRDIPFWIIAAGGKHDVTIKWWESRRYQEVVDAFQGRIQFVQVGAWGHHHPKLRGAIDLRGRTHLRELVRLVYHAQGVLCSITALMHLAAAIEPKARRQAPRPCVVIAGGREPAHWEAYPNHQFIHTNGALDCCSHGGCWKDRTVPLRDGDIRDRKEYRCVKVVQQLPACMDMITSAEVIRRIELYFTQGRLSYLSPAERRAAEQGVKKTARNPYDRQTLTLHEAGLAFDEFRKTLPSYPDRFDDRGIVICGGGVRYFTCAWVCLQMLRRLGCSLPIQLWYLGHKEMTSQMRDLLAPLAVECIDAHEVRRSAPVRVLRGWEMKPYAILHSRFREVLLLDADNVPVVNPEFLFETPQFRQLGAIFWPDYPQVKKEKNAAIWRSCGLPYPKEAEFETGQIVVDKQRCWQALSLTMWLNENSDLYYQYLHGDKETFHIAFRKLRQSYALVPHPIHRLAGTMCQHDFEGRRIFQHRNTDKWDFFLRNRLVKGFWWERECREDVRVLQRLWDGGASLGSSARFRSCHRSRPARHPIRISTVMISCPEREELRRRTLANLSATDWDGQLRHVEIDTGHGRAYRKRQTACAYRALKRAVELKTEYILFLEDDLDFNRHLQHNLLHWPLLRNREVTLASLYNPGVQETACDAANRARIVAPRRVFGSQAFIISHEAARYFVRHWNDTDGMQDLRMAKLAGRIGRPLFYHAPSLVQHIGKESVFGGGFHQALDFDRHWRCAVLPGNELRGIPAGA
jgi:ADP-heptose:LPS heptosyltransferase